MEYYKVQDLVLQYLINKKNKGDYAFSLRKKFSKSDNKSYFIGTEKGKYFAFSFWYFKLGYPGASIDLVSYIIEVNKSFCNIKLSFHQTNSPHDKQNQINLDFIKELDNEFSLIDLEKDAFEYSSIKSGLKMSTCKIKVKNIKSEEELIKKLDLIISRTYPIINKKFIEYQNKYKDWDAHKYTNIETDDMLENVKKKHQLKVSDSKYDLKWYELKHVIHKIDDNIILNKYFDLVSSVLNEFNLSGDEDILYTSSLVKKNRIQLTIGSRYVCKIDKVNSKTHFGVYVLTEDALNIINKYKLSQKIDESEERVWIEIPGKDFQGDDVLNSIIKLAKISFEGQSKSQFRTTHSKKFNPWVSKIALNIDLRKKMLESTKSNYYVLGAYWDESKPTDQTDRFLKDSIWQNGWNDKFINEVNEVNKGDLVAIKAVTAIQKKSIMKLKALGIVTENKNDGKNLIISWIKDFIPKSVDFTGNYWSTIAEVSKNNHIDKIWFKFNENTDQEEDINSNAIDINNMKAHNTILFGPPGTGKTYELSHEYFKIYTDKESKRSREELLDELLIENKYTWFDVIAAIIKEEGKSSINKILNHELIQSKTRVQNAQTPRHTIWGQLLQHGQLDCENIKTNPVGRREPMIIWKDDDSNFNFNNMEADELIVESIELLDKCKNLSENNTTPIKRYEFITFHQAFSYEDFIEGIKPVMDEETDELKYEIKDGVFKQICNRAKNDPENKYALFIDEINRGNVANIFGELITLIEPDKRAGMDNALSVKLPYSKTIFSVPNNLDIIGTMNTADRSVEALDTALRRRFEFEEMLPNSSLLSNIRCEDIKLDRMLNTINGRIEKLLDKDHQIGHSYFMNSNNTLSKSDLQGIFKNKIIPLLQEYFYGDFGKIGLVLGNSFIKENKEKIAFSKFPYDDRDLIDERKVYQLSDIENLEATEFKSIYEKSE